MFNKKKVHKFKKKKNNRDHKMKNIFTVRTAP